MENDQNSRVTHTEEALAKRHLLFIPSFYPRFYLPGNGIFFRDQAQSLAKRGHQVGVIFPDLRNLKTLHRGQIFRSLGSSTKTLDGRLIELSQHFISPPKMPRLRRKFFLKIARGLFERYVEEYGAPDIIHAQSALYAGEAAMILGEKYNLPYVVTEHSTAFARKILRDWEIPLVSTIFDSAAAVLAVSKGLAEMIQKHTSSKVAIVPNMVDTSFFSLAVRSPPDSKGKIAFCTIALMTKKKGLDLLLRAFAEHKKRQHNIFLHLVGDGPEKMSLKKLAQELGIQEDVKFWGRLDRVGIREVLRESDFFVLPSRFETFGVVLLEALATGMPVLATRCGGPEYFLKPGVAVLVEAGSQEALEHGFYSLIKLAKKPPESFRAFVEESFSSTAVCRKIENVYQSCLGT